MNKEKDILLATNNYSDFDLNDYAMEDYATNYYSKEYNDYCVVKDYLNNALDKKLSIKDYMEYLGINDFESDFEKDSEDSFYENFDCDIDNLKYDLKNYSFKVYASLGLWFGIRDCEPKEFCDFESVLSVCCEDYNRIYVDENGELIIEAIHHDGTNYFTIRDSEDKPLGIRMLKAIGRI